MKDDGTRLRLGQRMGGCKVDLIFSQGTTPH